MPATLEILSAIIRFGPEHDLMGQPYAGCVVVDSEGKVAILKGATGSMRKSYVPDIARVLLSMGFTHAVWFRLKPSGEFKKICINLDRWREV